MIRPLANTLSRVAPGLAACWLERLFLTPERWPTPPREESWLRGGRRKRLIYDGLRSLTVTSWGEGPVVLLVHGWSGRGSQLGAFVEPLVARGYRVVAFDAPNHGPTAPKGLTGLPEFATAIERVVTEVGPIQAIIAHSLGTAASTIALSRGLEVERLVYIAPPDNPGDYLYRAARFVGFSNGAAERAQARMERRFSFRFADARGTHLAEELTTPLLAIHDRGDLEVPHLEGRQLVASWPGAALQSTEGLGHRRILRDPSVVQAAVDFIHPRLPPQRE